MRIFISYRRGQTTDITGRIYDHLAGYFGKEQVFRDVDNIPLGVKFAKHLEEAMADCDLVVAIIGDDWNIERLHAPKDFLRSELEFALKRDIPIIPVLVGGVQLPDPSQLPESLAQIFDFQSANVDSEGRFSGDIQYLIREIEQLKQRKQSDGQGTARDQPVIEVRGQGPAAGRSVIGSPGQGPAVERPVIEVPTWAVSSGIDPFGTYADIAIQGSTQRMRRIAPGKFLMGSPESEADRSADEVQHEVELTAGFWMADTACTQALWQAVTGSNPSRFKQGNIANLPVETVSWDDCQDFLKRANALVPGLALRLPTEAEWEYACRAGTTTPYSFGKTITPAQVNYDGNYPYGGGAKGEYRETTVPVGSLPPNPWGLFEMHGNLWEWCEDWYAPYSTNSVKDPRGPGDGQYRVLRGGSWDDYAGDSRSSSRYSDEPGFRSNDFGFRFVRGR